MSNSQLAYRTDKRVSFAVPTTERAWEAYFAAPGLETADAMVDTELLDAVRAAIHEEVGVNGRPASVGRGASAYGAALQLLLEAGGVGGAIQSLVWGGKLTRAAYRELRKRLGHRPNVSLGAATFLAAADLADRMGFTDFELLGSGDTSNNPPDSSFTGDDTFWVVFVRMPCLYVYIVAANGRVHYRSGIPKVLFVTGWQPGAGPGGGGGQHLVR